MKAHKRAAFLTGLDRAGYGIVRSLAPRGVKVAALAGSSVHFARFSKYCDRVYGYSGADERQFCRFLLERRVDFDHNPVLFATSEWFAYLLARNQEELSEAYQFHRVAPETLLTIVDKGLMADCCREAGVLIPRTHATRPDEDLDAHARQFTYPCIIKPARIFDASFPSNRKNFIAESPADLLAVYAQYPELKGTTVWQELIEGTEENILQCALFADRPGEIRASVCVRKLRQYPPDYGVICLGRTEDNAFVTNEARRLIRHLGYVGLADVEFKYRPSDGRYYFIEMNATLPEFSALFPASGVDLAWMAYDDLCGEKTLTASPRQQNGVHWIDFQHDLRWYYDRGGKDPRSLLKWLRSVARAQSDAWRCWRDPKPMVAVIATIVRDGTAMLVRKMLPPSAASTHRRNG